MEDLGTYTEGPDGKVELRYERLYPRPIDTVWAALITPERLADWLGAVDLEPRVGGRFNCFVNRDEEAQTRGEVLAWEPPRLLEFSWRTPESPDGRWRELQVLYLHRYPLKAVLTNPPLSQEKYW